MTEVNQELDTLNFGDFGEDSPAAIRSNVYARFSALREMDTLYYSEPQKAWLVTRYDDVKAILRDTETFKNDHTRQAVEGYPQLQATDGDLHKLSRSAVMPKMMMENLAKLEPEVKRVVSEVLDEAEARGKNELMKDIAFEIPRRIVTPFLGISREHSQRWYELVDPLVGFDPEKPPNFDLDAAVKVSQFIDSIIEEKRANPGDDLISELIAIEQQGELPENGVEVVFRSIGFAALDTTINLLANGTVLLADNPQQRDQLIANPDCMQGAINEMLRLESPTQLEPRFAAKTVEFNGVTIEKGQELLIYLGAANRDETKYPNADTFDLRRANKDHLAFGFGVHKCIGQHLAQFEARVYFAELLKRFPEYRIGKRRYLYSPWARSFAEVEFFTA